jgi:hypothetical protein
MRYCGAALLLALGALPAAATQFRLMDLDEMVRRADQVVHARALSSRVETDPQTHAHYTVTRFEVIESGLGTLHGGAELELRLLGGHAPGSAYRTTVPGMPRFEPGEERILFLRATPDGRWLIVGERGALRLADSAEGPVVVEAPAPALSVLERTIRFVPARVARSDRPADTTGPAAAEEPEAAARRTGAGFRSAPTSPPTATEFLDRVRRLAREEVRP